MQNLVEIGSLVPEKQPKMFNILQPTNDDGQKQIAMGHLGDSGELKSNWCRIYEENSDQIQKLVLLEHLKNKKKYSYFS